MIEVSMYMKNFRDCLLFLSVEAVVPAIQSESDFLSVGSWSMVVMGFVLDVVFFSSSSHFKIFVDESSLKSSVQKIF